MFAFVIVLGNHFSPKFTCICGYYAFASGVKYSASQLKSDQNKTMFWKGSAVYFQLFTWKEIWMSQDKCKIQVAFCLSQYQTSITSITAFQEAQVSSHCFHRALGELLLPPGPLLQHLRLRCMIHCVSETRTLIRPLSGVQPGAPAGVCGHGP